MSEKRCDDPFWIGCNGSAVYHRDRIWSDVPNYPTDICERCYNALLDNDDLDENEWNRIL